MWSVEYVAVRVSSCPAQPRCIFSRHASSQAGPKSTVIIQESRLQDVKVWVVWVRCGPGRQRLARVNLYTRRGHRSDLTQQTSATQPERLPCTVSCGIFAMVMSLELRRTSTTIGGLLTCRSRRRRAGRRWLFDHEDTLVSCDPAQPRCIESRRTSGLSRGVW